MRRNKPKRPSWFKVFLSDKALICAVPDEVAGRALKAALCYFESGDSPKLDAVSAIVFAALKPHVDEAFEDFQRSVDMGRAGSKKRWDNEPPQSDSPPIAPLYPPYSPPIGGLTEAEAEAEAEAEGRRKMCVSATPPQNTHTFSPPSVDDVREYCDKQGYSTIDPERFISYYGARGWRIGQTAITDWRAAVDTWNRKDTKEQHGKSKRPRLQIGTVV